MGEQRSSASRDEPDTLAQRIGRAAIAALYDELALAPKPGLVTLASQGSHDDMDARTFLRSLFALRHYFVSIAAMGAQGLPFGALEVCGREAEARMLAATGGINTHRGAIFTLGLLCAAAGRLLQDGEALGTATLRATLLTEWGDALALRGQRGSSLPGGMAARRHGLRGASAQAAAGFPILFETALPAWASAAARGLTAEQIRLEVLFSLIASLDDCNLAHRGGLEGLTFARRAARRFLAEGGAGRPDGVAAAQAIGKAFVARRLSPGGSADILSAACWFARLGGRMIDHRPSSPGRQPLPIET